MSNDPQRTRSDKKKLPAPSGTQLLSVPEREIINLATQTLQRSPIISPNFSNTSPNNPFFQLGVKLHRPKSPHEEHIEDIEDTPIIPKQKILVKKERIHTLTSTISEPALPEKARIRTSPKETNSRLSLSPRPSTLGTPVPSQASLQSQIEAVAHHAAAITKEIPFTLRERELELAAFAGKKERQQLIHSRALGSQDSNRSHDGPMTKFLPKTADGYLKNI
jgi:hypothetical protein